MTHHASIHVSLDEVSLIALPNCKESGKSIDVIHPHRRNRKSGDQHKSHSLTIYPSSSHNNWWFLSESQVLLKIIIKWWFSNSMLYFAFISWYSYTKSNYFIILNYRFYWKAVTYLIFFSDTNFEEVDVIAAFNDNHRCLYFSPFKWLLYINQFL